MSVSHEQAVRESQWDADEALDWACERWRQVGQWPRRRFRVVVRFPGGAVIRSRLVLKTTAERVRARVGGCIEELIPGRQAYLERTADKPQETAHG